MDKEQLKQLKYLKTEIEVIKKQIEELDYATVTDSVKGSSAYFPYVARNFKIEGLDEEGYNYKFKRLRNKLNRKIDELMDLVEETNEFIDSIEDSLTRQIITLRYVNGLPWNQVAESLGQGYTEDSVRMISNRFLEKM